MGAINKIIYFTYSNFDDRDYERWGVNFLKNAGFDVEVWEFTPFLFPNIYKNRQTTTLDKDGSYRFFTNPRDILESIGEISEDTFIINLIHYSLKSYIIYRAISKKQLKYAVFVALSIPTSSMNNNLSSKLIKLIHLTPSKLINYLFSKCPFSLLGVKPASIILAGGEYSIKNHRYPVDSKTDVLWGHSFDYDLFLSQKEASPKSTDKIMGVFLDVYLPFHVDYDYLGILPPMSKEEYYPLMCRFFKYLEDQYGAKIIIAAHPLSEYHKHPDYFEGREIIKGKTIDLVKQCQFAMAHMSTSINMAVLYYKPIIFITTNKLENTYMKQFMDQFALLLGKKTINIDQPISLDLKKELDISTSLYDNYKNSFIKKNGSEEIPFWQIFANKMKNYNF